MSLSNGHIHDKDKKENEKEDNENDDDESKTKDEISPNLLEVGMLQHHEIENFSMDEHKIEATCRPASWSNCDATTFNVRRGPNYRPGQKSPSKKALYSVFAMDAYKLPTKINKIFSFINIDKYISKYASNNAKTKHILPPLFILNCMIPNYPPDIIGGKSDGEGFQFVLYAHLTTQVQSEINSLDEEAQRPAVKLLRDFIHSDLVDSEIRNRFKVIARVMNPSYTDFGFLANRLVRQYNGKPFLARTSSTFYYEECKYFAADIDVHVFGYPARRGLSYVKDTIQTAIYDIGLVVEGHSNDQLPEQILACCRISKMGINLCKAFPSNLQQIYSLQCNHNQNQNQNHTYNNNSNSNNGSHRKTQSLLNGKKTKDNNNNEEEEEEENIDNIKNINHRNGNIVSKSASSLPSITTNNVSETHKNEKTDKTQNNSSWGWGYFG